MDLTKLKELAQESFNNHSAQQSERELIFEETFEVLYFGETYVSLGGEYQYIKETKEQDVESLIKEDNFFHFKSSYNYRKRDIARLTAYGSLSDLNNKNMYQVKAKVQSYIVKSDDVLRPFVLVDWIVEEQQSNHTPKRNSISFF